MKRRTAIGSISTVTTHALFPSILGEFLSSCNQTGSEKQTENFSQSALLFFKREELELIKELIDIIIPATDTKSASEVNTHFFLDEVIAKCLDADQQRLIREGLSRLQPALAKSKNKESLISSLDKDAFQEIPESAYFKTIKQLTLIGFFTSQEGTTQASNYVKIPGDYQGKIPLDENTRNYGKTNLQYYL